MFGCREIPENEKWCFFLEKEIFVCRTKNKPSKSSIFCWNKQKVGTSLVLLFFCSCFPTNKWNTVWRLMLEIAFIWKFCHCFYFHFLEAINLWCQISKGFINYLKNNCICVQSLCILHSVMFSFLLSFVKTKTEAKAMPIRP